MKILTLCSALIFLALASSVKASERCEEFLNFEKSINADTPKMIDEHTELIQTIVNCETETILNRKRVLITEDMLPEGIQERKQRQYVQLNCNNRGVSSLSGWIAKDVIVDKDYKYLFTLTSTPEDCSQ